MLAYHKPKEITGELGTAQESGSMMVKRNETSCGTGCTRAHLPNKRTCLQRRGQNKNIASIRHGFTSQQTRVSHFLSAFSPLSRKNILASPSRPQPRCNHLHILEPWVLDQTNQAGPFYL